MLHTISSYLSVLGTETKLEILVSVLANIEDEIIILVLFKFIDPNDINICTINLF